MDSPRRLREEARTCRVLAREISDPAGIAMLRDRAEQLDRRAADLERYAGARKPAEGSPGDVVALRPPRSPPRPEPGRRPH